MRNCIIVVLCNSESCGRSHAIPMLTLPACAAGLALCQQRRALGVNHLHASVWQKARSVSFHPNKPVGFLISICGKFIASFGTLRAICRQCSDNCTESETGKKNEGTKRLTFIFVKGLPAWVSRTLPAGPFWAAPWRERGGSRRKVILFSEMMQ